MRINSLKLITLIGKLLKWVNDLSIFFHIPITRTYDVYLSNLIQGMLSELSSLLCSKLFFDFYFDENHKLDPPGQEFKTKNLSIFICNTTPFSAYLFWKEISQGTLHTHSFEIPTLPCFSNLCHFHRQKFSTAT
jgi:hypothetical protein